MQTRSLGGWGSRWKGFKLYFLKRKSNRRLQRCCGCSSKYLGSTQRNAGEPVSGCQGTVRALKGKIPYGKVKNSSKSTLKKRFGRVQVCKRRKEMLLLITPTAGTQLAGASALQEFPNSAPSTRPNYFCVYIRPPKPKNLFLRITGSLLTHRLQTVFPNFGITTSKIQQGFQRAGESRFQ